MRKCDEIEGTWGEEGRDLSRGRQDKDMRKNMEHEGTGKTARREGGREGLEKGRAWKERRREGGEEGAVLF